jgi:hypothetical protein
VVTTSNAAVTLAIASQPSTGATLTCANNPVTPTNGVATFANCKVTGKIGSYTLSATASGLGTTTSNPFTITPGTPAALVFTTQPGGGANGANLTTQPAVTIEDASGNTVTSSTAAVTLAIATQPSTGATLTCTNNTVNAVNGVASFANCKIVGKIGSYALSATMTGPSLSVTSNLFTITPGTATQLVFSTQPVGGVTEGTSLGTSGPAVTVEDSGGNTVTTDTGSVALSIGTYSAGNGGTTQGTLGCTNNTVNAVAGVATFANCQISGTAAAGTYTLNAARTGLATGSSSNVSITAGGASKLTFSTEPGGAANGANLAPQPAVTIEDANSNVVTTSNAAVTLAIASQPSTGATLTCANNPVTPTNGVATFANCQIAGKVGSYTLSATINGPITVNSNPLSITVGAAAQLVFTTQPVGGVTEGTNFATEPVVTVEDAGGNVVTSDNANVSLSIGTYSSANGGTTQGTLTCTSTLTVKAVNGVAATFAGCQISGTLAAGTYSLNASSAGLVGSSNNMSIVAGGASKLAFTSEPLGGVNEATNLATEPVVSVEDSNGNTVTSDNGTVALSIGTYAAGNGGTNQGTLGCTNTTVNAVAGVATFANCQITGTAAAGTYTLNAARTGLTTVSSSSLSITAGSASKLAFSIEPGGGAGGVAFATQPVVNVEDGNGNTVSSGTNSNASVTLAIASQPGTGATLACTTNPLVATAGVATFAGCKITGTAGAYTMSATASGLGTTTSSSFSIGAPGIALVEQVVANGGANLTTQTITLPSASTVGDTLILLVGDDHTNSATVSSVTGGGVTTWTNVTEKNGGNGHGEAEIWYGPVTSSASNVTVTLSGSTNWQLANVSEWSGIASTNPVDASTSSSGTATSFAAGPITTTVAGDLVISDAWTSFTPGFTTAQNSTTAGYTALNQTTAGGAYYRAWGAYQVDASTGPISAGWTGPGSGFYATAIAAFKP